MKVVKRKALKLNGINRLESFSGILPGAWAGTPTAPGINIHFTAGILLPAYLTVNVKLSSTTGTFSAGLYMPKNLSTKTVVGVIAKSLMNGTERV